MPAKQRLAKAGCNVQRRRKPNRNNGEKQPAGHTLQSRAKCQPDKMRHAARAGEMPPQDGKHNGNRENQYNQNGPRPQTVISGYQCRQCRYGEHARP